MTSPPSTISRLLFGVEQVEPEVQRRPPFFRFDLITPIRAFCLFPRKERGSSRKDERERTWTWETRKKGMGDRFEAPGLQGIRST